MKQYNIGGVMVPVRNFRTYKRRLAGYDRGELTVDGQTILAKDRSPAGTPMRKKSKKG